jgi:NAD(P)-dependent dehydrogenase (short-subunit alcohol dehydrogenase family)
MRDRVFITGTTRGLGSALAQQFEASGWEVIAFNRPDFDLQSVDPNVFEAHKDGDAGRVVLVNNAASHHIQPARDLDPTIIERELTANILGPIKLITLFLQSFANGEVANITSVAASTPFEHWSLYGTAKSALNAFMEHLKVEGVKCFSLNPGAIATDMQVAIANSSSPLPSGIQLRNPQMVAKNLAWQIMRATEAY